MEQAAKKYYEANLLHCDNRIKRYERQLNTYAIFRLIVFLAGLFLIYESLQFNRIWVTELAVILFIFSFGLLVKRQSLVEKQKKHFIDLRTVNNNEISLIDSYDNIYSNGSQYVNSAHPYSADLDIFGKKSLFAKLNRCATPRGNNKLASWFNGPAAGNVILQRQQGTIELSSKAEWIQYFQTVLLFLNNTEDHAVRLFEYLKISPPRRNILLKTYVRWTPWLFLAAGAATYFIGSFVTLLIAIVILNGLISRFHRSQTAYTYARIGRISETLSHYRDAIEHIKKGEWRSPVCIQLSGELKDSGQANLSRQLKQLTLHVRQMDTARMGLLGVLLTLGACWDVRQMYALEDWKRNNQLNLEEAFNIVADFEALSSLGTLHNNNPGWCFPEISSAGHYTVQGKDIGHPLIPQPLRVSNDFELNDDLKIDIITGSNMAGKSTFLRTLGINIVLGLSGSPVCASAFALTPMLVFSYMRITDSLNENTSTFKAELDRLKQLLDTLDQDQKVFFLIDEMLRGTNSADKYLGSKAVIEKLISKKAVGIVATHDLQISELEQQYPNYIRNFYFDITIEGNDMQFDYKIKRGACKTFNASMLLRRLGIITGDQGI